MEVIKTLFQTCNSKHVGNESALNRKRTSISSATALLRQIAVFTVRRALERLEQMLP